MTLQSQLKKSELHIFQFTNGSKIYQSKKTEIQSFHNIHILTTEFEKYQFYYYGLKNKLSCIPKIHQLIADDKHGIYYIQREFLFPIILPDKLDRVKKLQYWLENRIPGGDKIAEDLLKFYYLNAGSLEFDFGPHWMMENIKGKLVVSDAFRGNEERSKNLSNQF